MENKVNRVLRFVLAAGAAALLLTSCDIARKDEKFVGVWSNQNATAGDIKLEITRDGDKLLVKKIFISKNAVFGKHSARVVDGYLVIDGDTIYEKLSYSPSEDELLPAGAVSLPGFHRVK